MKKLHLEKNINASRELIWECIVDPDHYRAWTEAFYPGSMFKGDWSKGSKMHFVIVDESGVESGMVSEIAENIWPEFISIHHLGFVKDGVEDYDSPSVKEWVPAYENYQLVKNEDGTCTFIVEQDIPEDQAEEFTATWLKALDLLAHRLETSEEVGKVITLIEGSTFTTNEIWDRLVVPEKVMTWNFASEDWHCPKAVNTLEVGGEFHYEMASVNGEMSFDFGGTYELIEKGRKLYFKLEDDRKVRIDIIEKPYGCIVEERFEAESENNLNLQRLGWTSILRRLVTR